VAAPGVDVLGAGPGDEYWVGRGTSQATALVSGVAALIKSRHPAMSPALVAQALSSSPARKSAYNTGTGFGVVDAYRALTVANTLARHRATASGPGVQDPARAVGKGAHDTPVAVNVRRDQRTIAISGGIALAGLVSAAASLIVLILLLRRARREEHDDLAMSPPQPPGLPT
jgi:subtilisin family serine protease